MLGTSDLLIGNALTQLVSRRSGVSGSTFRLRAYTYYPFSIS
jgi:hypothetical protein